RGRRGLETESLAGRALDLRVGSRVRSDCPRELSDSHPFEGAPESRAVPVELEGPAGQLEPECGRLSVDPVRAPDLESLPLLLGSSDNRDEGPLETGEDQHAGVADLECQCRVDDVRGRQAVVKPPPFLSE